jgi:hypothetical protein
MVHSGYERLIFGTSKVHFRFIIGALLVNFWCIDGSLLVHRNEELGICNWELGYKLYKLVQRSALVFLCDGWKRLS